MGPSASANQQVPWFTSAFEVLVIELAAAARPEWVHEPKAVEASQSCVLCSGSVDRYPVDELGEAHELKCR